MTAKARLVAPGSLIGIRALPVGWMAPSTARTFALEVLAASDCPECRICRRDGALGTLGTLEVSTDGGATYSTVPDAGSGAMAGPNLGALAAGARVPVTLRYTLPAALPGAPLARSRSIEIPLGLGA